MNKTRLLFVLLCAATLSSCAYFNTFYNTKKYFKEAMRENARRRGDEPTAQEKQKFDKTISQASKVLQFYPNSKYVDDALMILGESFYYVQDYRKAIRKFQELRQLYPRSNYAAEALLWLAKSEIQIASYPEAESDLQKLETTYRDKSLLTEAGYWRGELSRRQKQHEPAIKAYARVADKLKPAPLKYDAYMKMGECYLQLARFQEAAGTFHQAGRIAKEPDARFVAELQYGRALSGAGDLPKATKILARLVEEFYNNKDIGLAKLELANTILAQADTAKATEWYKAIIEEHPRTEGSAGAYLMLGKLLEARTQDYASARDFYEKSRMQAARSSYSAEASERSENIQALLQVDGEIKRLRTQLDRALGKMDAAADSAQAGNAPGGENLGTGAADSLRSSIARKEIELAELFLFRLQAPDSAMARYLRILSENDSPEMRALAFYSLVYIFQQLGYAESMQDSILHILATKYPQTPQGQKAAKLLGLPGRSLAEDSQGEYMLSLAEKALFSQGQPQEAIQRFRDVAQNAASPDLRAKALFAMGWIYEQRLGDNEAAVSTYKELIDLYPQSVYGKVVKKKVAFYDSQHLLAAGGDSTSMGQQPAGAPVAGAAPATATPYRPNIYVNDSTKVAADRPAATAETRRKAFLLKESEDILNAGAKKETAAGDSAAKAAPKKGDSLSKEAKPAPRPAVKDSSKTKS